MRDTETKIVYARRRRRRAVIDLRVVAGSVVVAALLLTASMGALFATRSRRPPAGEVITVITLIPANTATPAAPTSNPAGQPGSAETPVPTPPPGVVAVGAFVQVVGTGGDGLRLRDQAGLAGQVLMLGAEAEVFRIEAGPQEVDGYTWWKLVGPFDPARGGWAVANYLQIVQNP